MASVERPSAAEVRSFVGRLAAVATGRARACRDGRRSLLHATPARCSSPSHQASLPLVLLAREQRTACPCCASLHSTSCRLHARHPAAALGRSPVVPAMSCLPSAAARAVLTWPVVRGVWFAGAARPEGAALAPASPGPAAQHRRRRLQRLQSEQPLTRSAAKADRRAPLGSERDMGRPQRRAGVGQARGEGKGAGAQGRRRGKGRTGAAAGRGAGRRATVQGRATAGPSRESRDGGGRGGVGDGWHSNRNGRSERLLGFLRLSCLLLSCQADSGPL